MTVYLGTLGRMVELYTTPSASVVAEERYSFTTTLEGRRKAQVRPVGRRTWTWEAGFADASEQGVVMGFASGSWGAGPFVFVSADAPFVNLLTPEVSTCGPEADVASHVSVAGPHYLGFGEWSSRSLVSSDPTIVMYFGSVRTPVLAGRKVTGSAWVSGDAATVRLVWYDAAGVFITSNTGAAAATATTTVRAHVSAFPPANAASCVLAGVNAIRGAQPAITWTDSLVPWGDGQGCAKAVVHAVSRTLAQTSASGTYSNMAFTISEVG